MRRRWFLFFFLKSVSQRKGRVLIASASVTLAVAVVTGMIGITLGIRERLGAELKAYGANTIVSPGQDSLIEFAALATITGISHVEEVSGQYYGKALVNGQPIEFIGLDFNSIQRKGWRVTGSLPRKKGEIAVGINLKQALRIEPGTVLTLTSEKAQAASVVACFFEKGGPEDSAILLSLEDAWELGSEARGFSTVLVRAVAGKLEAVAREIRTALPDASVKTLRQVAVAEESLLRKIQLLMAAVTLVVLFATSVSVASTMGANVLERREEIGLMKALGARRREIGVFYRAEALLIGLSGGLAGFALGYAAAQVISRAAFSAFIPLPPYLLFFSLLCGAAISVLASRFPVRDALRYNPSVILRGE